MSERLAQTTARTVTYHTYGYPSMLVQQLIMAQLVKERLVVYGNGSSIPNLDQ